jgi:hypothetical protein
LPPKKVDKRGCGRIFRQALLATIARDEGCLPTSSPPFKRYPIPVAFREVVRLLQELVANEFELALGVGLLACAGLREAFVGALQQRLNFYLHDALPES